MTSPLSVTINARPATRTLAAPYTMVLVVPKTEVDGSTVIPADINTLTEVTESTKGAVLGSGDAVDMYDTIESGSAVRLFVLPFEVDSSDMTESTRLGNVRTALQALETATERAKLPGPFGADIIVCPRETGLGTGANAAVTELRALGLDTSLGAVSFVDAGTIPHAEDLGTAPTVAQVTAWQTANTDPNVMAVSNRGDVEGHAEMFGSVIAAGHYARYASAMGVQHQAANLIDVLVGADDFTPEREFVVEDGSSPAIALAAAGVSSLVTWNGRHYFWGGKTGAPATDPRTYTANAIIAHRIVKQGRQILAPFLGQRGTGRNIDSIQVALQNTLSAQYVPAAVQGLDALDVDFTGNRATAEVSVQFYGFIEAIRLIADVYI